MSNWMIRPPLCSRTIGMTAFSVVADFDRGDVGVAGVADDHIQARDGPAARLVGFLVGFVSGGLGFGAIFSSGPPVFIGSVAMKLRVAAGHPLGGPHDLQPPARSGSPLDYPTRRGRALIPAYHNDSRATATGQFSSRTMWATEFVSFSSETRSIRSCLESRGSGVSLTRRPVRWFVLQKIRQVLK